MAVAAAPHCRWCVQWPCDLSHRGAVEQVQQSCSLRQLCIEMANLPRSSRFRSASSLSCTRCWPWQATVLKVISALGLELHVTAARCQLRRRARRWLSKQPLTRVDRTPYTLCYAIPVRRRAGVGWCSSARITSRCSSSRSCSWMTMCYEMQWGTAPGREGLERRTVP